MLLRLRESRGLNQAATADLGFSVGRLLGMSWRGRSVPWGA